MPFWSVQKQNGITDTFPNNEYPLDVIRSAIEEKLYESQMEIKTMAKCSIYMRLS